MSYEVGYIDGLAGAWVADPLPVSNAPIAPYRTGQDGGFAYQAPNYSQPSVGSPTAVLDRALDSETYVTPTGARAWKPTAAEDALVDSVTRNPLTGLDELVEAGGRGAAGRGIQNLPYVGDVVGGAVDGALAYGATGSVTHGVLAGAGSSIGGLAGTTVGASIGAVGGPVGVAIGGFAGGAVGSAFGNAAGLALANLLNPLPPSNKNGVLSPTGQFPFLGGQSPGIAYEVTMEWNTVNTDGSTSQTPRIEVRGGPWLLGPVGGLELLGQPGGLTLNLIYNSGVREFIGSSSAPQGGFRNHRITNIRRIDGLPDTGGNPPELTEPSKPTVTVPRIPGAPGFRLPNPVPVPTIRPNPTSRPTENPDRGPIGTPFGYPNPFTGIPSFPDFGLPGMQPTSQPHTDPYPDTNPPNSNPTEQPGEEPGDCDPCKGIQQIKDKLEAIFSQQFQGSISLFPCEDGAPATLISNDVGLAGLSAQITILSQALTEVWEKVKCPPVTDLALPESWAIKTAKSQPQYVITWRPVEASGSRWSTVIPHPKFISRSNAYAAIDNITYSRGDVMLNVQHSDNSSSIFNVESKSEADRILNWVLSITNDGFADSAYPKVTEGLKARIAPRDVRIANIKYFSLGQGNLVPDWIIGFDAQGNKIPG